MRIIVKKILFLVISVIFFDSFGFQSSKEQEKKAFEKVLQLSLETKMQDDLARTLKASSSEKDLERVLELSRFEQKLQIFLQEEDKKFCDIHHHQYSLSDSDTFCLAQCAFYMYAIAQLGSPSASGLIAPPTLMLQPLVVGNRVTVDLGDGRNVALCNVPTARQTGLTCGPCAITTAGSIIASKFSHLIVANPCQLRSSGLSDVHYFEEQIANMRDAGIEVQNSDIGDLLQWWQQSRLILRANGTQEVAADESLELALHMPLTGGNSVELWAPRMTVIDSTGSMQLVGSSLSETVCQMWGQQHVEGGSYAFVVLINTGQQGVVDRACNHWFPLTVIQYSNGEREYFVSDSLGIDRSSDRSIAGSGSINVHTIVREIELGIMLKYSN